MMFSGRDTLQKATSEMSYHGVGTNVLTDNSIALLRQLAQTWKITPPAPLAEPEAPKESAKK